MQSNPAIPALCDDSQPHEDKYRWMAAAEREYRRLALLVARAPCRGAEVKRRGFLADGRMWCEVDVCGVKPTTWRIQYDEDKPWLAAIIEEAT